MLEDKRFLHLHIICDEKTYFNLLDLHIIIDVFLVTHVFRCK